LQGLNNLQYRDGRRHDMASLNKHMISSSKLQRNEKSVLDKVEDMDIDNQSDQEGTCEESVAGSSSNSNLTIGRSLRNNNGNKDCIENEVIEWWWWIRWIDQLIT
jgi:hypothetical protein